MPMFNFGGQAQLPQQAQPQQGGGFLQQLLAPENAMPIAAALMGQQGNGQNFSNAMSAYGQTAAQTAGKNKTLDFFRKQAPEFAQMVEAGMPVNEAWQTYTQQRYAKPASNPFGDRAAAAQQYGLDPNSEEGRNFILSGDLPGMARDPNKPASIAEFEYGQQHPDYAEWAKTKGRDAQLTATDKKAILEADEMVMNNQNTIDMLDSVLTEPGGPGSSLNDRAGSGATARTQSWLARNDPTGFFDDQKGQATTELENVVLGQALANLKAIFGAAPTEGERKILVDLQASVDKTPQERRLIIERAKTLASRRMEFNQERANALRSNEFYKPGQNGQAAPGSANRTQSGVSWTVEP